MRAVLLALAVSAGLVGAYVALGGGGYRPSAVADPCEPRPRPPAGEGLDVAQPAVLAVLDGAACRLGTSREALLLDLLDRDRPGGADDAALADALRAGIVRARQEGALEDGEAALLLLALRTGGVQALTGLLLR